MNIRSNDYALKIEKMNGKKELLEKTICTNKNELKITQKDLIALEKAQAFIQQVAKDTQEQIRFMITDIVQLALDAVFQDEYIFDVEFEIKRGKTEAVLRFKKGGIDIDPMEASGGGVVDIASFALRIAAWSLGKSDNIIILDEPFRFLSKDLQPMAGEILHRLSSHLNVQIVMVTHNDSMINSADVIFEVSQKNGISNVVRKGQQ